MNRCRGEGEATLLSRKNMLNIYLDMQCIGITYSRSVSMRTSSETQVGTASPVLQIVLALIPGF